MAVRGGQFWLTEMADKQWGPGVVLEVVGPHVPTRKELRTFNLSPKVQVAFERERMHFVRGVKAYVKEHRQ